MEEFSRGKTITQEWIRSGLKNGTIEMRKFNLARGDGGWYPCPHYRPVVKGGG